MKAVEIRDLADAELVQKLKDTRAELFNLRFQLATGQLDNTGRIAIVKKALHKVQNLIDGAVTSTFWASSDGNTYIKQGSMFGGSKAMGVLSASLPSSAFDWTTMLYFAIFSLLSDG